MPARSAPTPRALAARVDAAAAALARADFEAFAEAAARLEEESSQAPPDRAALGGDVEALRALRRSLDNLAALMGHVAGVRFALLAVHPAHAAVYDCTGAATPARAAGTSREA